MWPQLRKSLSVVMMVGMMLSLLQPASAQAQTRADGSPPAPPKAARAASQAAGQKVLVDAGDSAAIQHLKQIGAELLVDYGAFTLWRAPEAETEKLLSHAGVTVRPDFDEIALRGRALNTLTGTGPDVPASLRQARIDGPQFWMVQFVGPIKSEWQAELTGLGLQIVAYLANNAYVVWGDEAALANLDALEQKNPLIQWTGPYHPAYRLAPSVLSKVNTSQPDDMLDVSVQFYTTPALAESLARLKALGGAILKPPAQVLVFTNISLRVPARDALAIAHWPDVFNLSPYLAPQKLDEVQNQIIAGNVSSVGGKIVPNAPGYLAWLSDHGFPTDPSQYPVVDIVDDGLDQGNITDVLHPDFHELGVLADPHRVVYIANCTVDPLGDGLAGHGNLNAGIVGAYNNLNGAPHVDDNGYRRGLGVSPYGRIASTKIFINAGSYNITNCGGTDAGVVFTSFTNGADLTSNSWGAPVGGDYDDSSQAYDALTRDAASSLAGHQPMLHIFAAGNSGPNANTVGSPGTAKNVLTVGATENVRDPGFVDGCNVTAADNADDMAEFSSRGPTDDNRVKPDIVAPGTHVQGPASQDPGYNGKSVCDQYHPTAQTLYAMSSGTSHSTPAVAGAASLAWEYYTRVLQPGQAPSPAMLKGLLINSARPIAGAGTTITLPSHDQGWGDVNLGRLTEGTPYRLIDQTDVFSNTGQALTYTGAIADATKPFRVTLAWTDAPGPLTGNAYVNDLNLEVTVNGVTYKGNVFSGASSTAGGVFDPRNNVEGVYLPGGSGGSYSVRVIAANIAGDGLPGNPDATDQDFALIIYNSTQGSSILNGTVTDGNIPLDNVTVQAVTNTIAFAATTDVTGFYSTTLPADTYLISAWKYGYDRPSAETATISGTVTTRNFTLTAQPSFSLSGALTDQVTGEPVSATVKVIDPVGGLITQTVIPASTYTFTLPGTGGTFSYTVQAEAPFYFPGTAEVNLTADTVRDLTLLSTLTGLQGYVRSLNSSQPISGAVVALSGPVDASGLTDNMGHYLITGLLTGTYTATVSAPFFTTVISPDIGVISNTVVSRDFTLASASLSFAPAELRRTLTLGESITDTSALVISNTGQGNLEYTLIEQAGDFTPAGLPRPAGGGPDAYGYTWRTSLEPGGPSYAFIDISGTGAPLNLIDDAEGNIASPFAFPFYGSASANLRVGNNGAILFNATMGEIAPGNSVISTTITNFLIAPFWDDIDSETGNVFWQVLGSAPDRQLVVQWHDRPHFNNIGSATFEAVLFEDGDLLYQYQDVDFGNATFDNGASATVGIRGGSAADSLQYSYNAPSIQDGLAICFDNPTSLLACGAENPGALPWLEESPATGTMPGGLGASQAITLSWSALPEAGIAQPGTYTGALRIHNNDPEAQGAAIPVTFIVEPPPTLGKLTGVISSTGVCDVNLARLTGIDVLITSSTGAATTTTTDDAGRYTYWLSTAQNPYTVTVTVPDQSIGEQGGINVSNSVTQTVDFTLRLQEPCLSASPEVTASLEWGDQVTRTLVVSNTGATPLDFYVFESDGSQTGGPPLGPVSPPDAAGYTWANVAYYFSDISATGTPLNLGDDQEATITSPFSFPFYAVSSADFRVGNNGAMLFNAITGDVGTSNTAMTSAPDNFIAAFWDDLDSESGNVYWEVLGTAPNRRLVVQWEDRPHYPGPGNTVTFQAILYESGNLLYQYKDLDFGNPGFNNGASATVGIRGVGSANSLQHSFNAASLTNGQAVCFRRPGSGNCGEAAVPWLSTAITSTVGLVGSQAISVTFDGGAVPVPGVYTTTLGIAHNAPQPTVLVPVTMTVTALETFGGIEGRVTGLAACDQPGAPLAGASVAVSGGTPVTLTTDAYGLYSASVVGGAGTPYTLTVSAGGYVTQTAMITVTQGLTTTTNFDLQLDAPCQVVTPAALEITQAEGTVVTETLTISNTGVADLHWTVTSAPLWIAVAPYSGTVESGSSSAVSVGFSAVGALPGVYTDTLAFASDDPAQPALTIPVTQTVLGYGLAASAPQDAKSGGPGGVVTYTLDVTNTGGLSDAFDLALSGNSFLTDAPASVGPLASGETASLLITVTVPMTASVGLTDTVDVDLISHGNPAQTASVSLTTTVVPAVYDVGPIPVAEPPTTTIGSVVHYTLTVTNLGNAPDTFTLTVSGNNFPMDLPPTVGPLLNGASVQVPITVTIPSDVEEGTVDTAIVTVTSQHDPAQAESVMLETVAAAPVRLIYLPLIWK